ncbi:MAG: amidohydrolase family protein [Bacteroidetes bacterium]|nr:amidohydrolase family protein [Rhodothermia bacterium]MCX7907088.1 amidohydrolase family protein [Bacteroidota bacterium]MDW8285498.1 amidohydrolase family protein [Bacteroidota bacterium]
MPSPNGRFIAFTALSRLYVMDLLPGTSRRLTNRERIEAQPAWSPDGAWLVFTTWSEAEGRRLYKVRPDGRGPTRLNRTSAVYWDPVWSPDGSRIVVIQGPARAYQEATGPRAPGAAKNLVWITAEGGEAVPIAPADGWVEPHFTQSQERIFLFHFERRLVSIRWDGSDEKAHVRVTGNLRPGQREPNRASLILVSPQAKQASAQVNHDFYVLTVAWVGSQALTISVDNPQQVAMPARKLTEIGGQFPAWSWEGQRVHWSMGNAHVVYDLERTKAFEDSPRQVRRNPADPTRGLDAARYRPLEVRIRIQAQRDIPQVVLLLRKARLIAMRGEEVLEETDICIRNNRIAAVEPRGSFPVPSEARIWDVSGKTIIPGSVDTHAHMWPVWGLHRSQVWLYLVNLAYGVTTTRDPQTSTTDVLTYADMIEAGLTLGPRIYSTGPGLFDDYLENPIRDLEHAKGVLRRYADYYDTKTIKMYIAGNRRQRQWIVQAARELDLTPTTEGGLDLKLNLTLMQDGYPAQEHAFPIYPLYEDVIRLASFTRLYCTPTLLVFYGGPFAETYTRENPHDEPKLAASPHMRNWTAKRADAAKGWTQGRATGSGTRSTSSANTPRSRAASCRPGAGSAWAATDSCRAWAITGSCGRWLPGAYPRTKRCATLYGAEAIGLERDLGSLEPGKLADLPILDKNPLENIRHTTAIRYVMKNRRLYKAETLDELWPRQRPLGRLPWQGEDPVGVPGLHRPGGR